MALIDELEYLNQNVEDAAYEDLEGFDVISTTVVDEWKHGTEKETVVKSNKTEKHYLLYWRDNPNCGFFDTNCDDIKFVEVFPEEVTTIKWRRV